MSTMRLVFTLLFAMLAVPPALAQEGWRELHSGMDVFVGSYSHRPPLKAARIVAIRIEQDSYRMAVTDLSRTSGPPTLTMLTNNQHTVAAINGAYVTSYAFPRPLGLARIGGSTLAQMNGRKPFSGVICVSRSGRARLIKTKTDPGLECADALEVGPFVVEEPGMNGIAKQEPPSRAFDRSVVCLDGTARIIFIRAERTALFDLAEFLRTPLTKGGLGCRVAANLSGDADSGLLWREKGELRNEGSLDASLATALTVSTR